MPGLLGLVLGVFALGPALGRGYVLVYDMVFLPDPPATRAMFGLSGGFPRQVPSDAVAALLGNVVPADLVQKALLLAVFGLAAWGAAALLPDLGALPRAATALLYVWNPFLAERLLLGQWALLLGYAGLPWALVALRSGRVPPLVLALVPAGIGGFAALDISALTLLPAGWLRGRWRGVARVVAVLAALALPWLVPGLLFGTGGSTDPRGVDLFAARSDTPLGGLGSLVSLGGIWNAETVPAGLGAWPAALGRLALALACCAAFVLFVRRNRVPELRGLAVSAAAGLVLAVVGLTGPGRAGLRELVGLWAGFGVLRDAQVYLAPLALLEALGAGLLVARLAAGSSDRFGRVAVGAVLAVAPIALLPGLAWGASGRLAAVQYPADWARARALINGDPSAGLALALPWGAYRAFPWNGGRTVLDPLPRALSRETVQDDGLRVGGVTLAPESPRARQAAALLARPGPLTGALAAAGYRYVVIERFGDTGALQARLPGAALVLSRPDLLVYRIADTTKPGGLPPARTAFTVTGDAITLGLVLWATAVTIRRTGHGKGPSPCVS